MTGHAKTYSFGDFKIEITTNPKESREIQSDEEESPRGTLLREPRDEDSEPQTMDEFRKRCSDRADRIAATDVSTKRPRSPEKEVSGSSAGQRSAFSDASRPARLFTITKPEKAQEAKKEKYYPPNSFWRDRGVTLFQQKK